MQYTLCDFSFSSWSCPCGSGGPSLHHKVRPPTWVWGKPLSSNQWACTYNSDTDCIVTCRSFLGSGMRNLKH
jgi:hypothetical protein